ncbi:hypothetical protein PCASD_04682 [Puccinia coronata f. sp. avenae]|uniref:Acyltransferase MbtK/IucB-like conserved domain-containing protein n=1 Tax=Puccinia coronata f. sp. avenae TaxID=200324 RepID=A0A2N5SMA3_9BASI|nr:hypothetical protein PCASD_19388 [Puccinia coronata f. sp. avenae]PLW42924.1 hypothetical protein PCASD_04682 [Puccinia coronata f. sp. avenae]
MSTVLVPRLRSPTFKNPPEGVQSIRVIRQSLDYDSFSLRLERVTSEKPQKLAELANSIGYALWDIVGSKISLTKPEITITLDSIGVERILELLQELSIEGSQDNPKSFQISRSWWYRRFPIFSHPIAAQEALCDSSDLNSSARPENVIRIPQSQLPPPPQTIYERYIVDLDSYFCLSIFGDSDADLNLLHTWLNDPRVDEYWKDAGDREFHAKWLRERYEDKHVLPILGSYRGTNGANQDVIEPFAYYEIYWAAEDKIARAYTADPFDRGIHMLVGSSAHRGPHRDPIGTRPSEHQNDILPRAIRI